MSKSRNRKRRVAFRRPARSGLPCLEPLEGRTYLSLIGVAPVFPMVSYDSTGRVSYTASTQDFKVYNGTPDSFAASVLDVVVGSPAPVGSPANLSIDVKVDNSGNLLGGVPGDDLALTGEIHTDTVLNGRIDASGTLLTGEVTQFGFQDGGASNNPDYYDFTFRVTGGALASLFGGYIAVTVESEQSTFTGSFATDFTGGSPGFSGAKGVIGGTETPVGSLPGAISGRVYQDNNNDGLVNGVDAGINGVTIQLTGTDSGGNVIAPQTVTTNNFGYYSFSNLGNGTYTVTELTEPGGYLDGKDTPGTLGGVAGKDLSGHDNFTSVVVDSAQFGQDYNFGEIKPASLSGSVYYDANNDNTRQVTESGIGQVTVTLTGANDLGAIAPIVVTTAADGTYSFGNLRPGNYTIAETQPAGYLDNAAGINSYAVAVSTGQQGAGYDFGEIKPASLSGVSWVDFNDDGLVDFNEKAIAGATITLTGTNDLGQTVNQVQQTDADGAYVFMNLRPGDYAISETQQASYLDGQDSLGTVAGQPRGTAMNDKFVDIILGSDEDGYNYNFGERPLTSGALAGGQTATIGFWQNKNGQKLINSLNGGAAATQLGNWLADTFPNMYGAAVGTSNLAGKTNAQIAGIYMNAFKVKGQKLDAQVMAVAFAAYVTDSTLAGNAGAAFGFKVSQYGVGVATFNLASSSYAAFGVTSNASTTTMSILDMLLATDNQAVNGVLYYNQSTSVMTMLRNLANSVYDAINSRGDIS